MSPVDAKTAPRPPALQTASNKVMPKIAQFPARIAAILCVSLAAACGAPFAAVAPAAPVAPAEAIVAASAVQVTPDLTVREIAPGVYVHTSWKVLPELGRFPSNGLVITGPSEALVVDTTWW
jgi:hypothetical protein